MRRIQVLSLLGTAALFAACDGSSSSAVSTTDGGDRPGNNTGGTGAGGSTGIFGAGGSGFTIGDAQAVMHAIPALGSAKRIISDARARLVGSGLDACSNGIAPGGGATGDLWCAFSTPGVALGTTELWVFNATKATSAAYAGTPVAKCDGTDPLCIRLTTNLWTDTPTSGPTFPETDRFDGDTLIYHADATSASGDLYEGPIYAWRPGWTAGRQISTKLGITCSGQAYAAVAVCLDSITPDPTAPIEFDLLAGSVVDSAQSQLPKVDHIHPLRSNMVSKWRSGFSRDGSYFGWSTGKTDTDAEILYLIKATDTADTTKKITVASDAARFTFSADSAKLFWLSGYNYDGNGSPSGTLIMTDFPPTASSTAKQLYPADPTKKGGVGVFLILSDGTAIDHGLGLFTTVQASKGDFTLLPDRTNPASAHVLIANIAGATLSPDLQYMLYSTGFDMNTNLTDAWVMKLSGGAGCALQRGNTTDLYGQPFLASSGMVFWTDNVDTTLFVGEGWRANPADCSGKVKFADNIDYWFTVKDKALIYSDNVDVDVADLKQVNINGASFGTSAVLQAEVNRSYALSLPAYDLAVFNIGPIDPSVNGLYVMKLTPGDGSSSPDAAVGGEHD